MLSDWREFSFQILNSLEKCDLDITEKLLLRDLLISRRRLHIDPEPKWASLEQIPLASGGLFDSRLAEVNVNSLAKIREFKQLFKYLAALLASLFYVVPTQKPLPKSVTLFFSDGFSEFSRPLFDEFIHEQRFQSILEKSQLIVQDRNVWKQKKIENSMYVKDIALYLFSTRIKRLERIFLFGTICRQLMKCRKFNRFGYLGVSRLTIEKIIWTHMMSQMEKANLVATNSYMEILPTAFYLNSTKIGKRYLLWYSNNNFSIPSQQSAIQSDNRIDFSCRSEVDVHLVWTSDFGNSIRNRNKTVEIQVVGSLMMYPKKPIEPLEGHFKIAVFDMTPWEGYPKMMFGSEQFMNSFIKDIVEISQEFPFTSIYLKPKRRFIRSGKGYLHSASYLSTIDKFQSMALLHLLDPRANIYGICDRVDMVIGFPFASPVIIGHELSKPSYYYNPEFSKDWQIRQSMDGVSVISGKENLRLKIQEIYRLKNPRLNQS